MSRVATQPDVDGFFLDDIHPDAVPELEPVNGTSHRNPRTQNAPPPAGSPILTCMADVTPEPVQWLWPGRIAKRKVTVFGGDPGLGKSLVTLDVAARITSGLCWPDDRESEAPTGSVVLLSAEDDLADTIRPRLDAAGADVRKIKALEGIRRTDSKTRETWESPVSLSDLRVLEQTLDRTPDAECVIIDPISAFLGGKVDSHNNSEMRTAILAPLAKLAIRYNVAVLCVTHLNKGQTTSALYRMSGSLAFVAAARAAWVFCRDPENPRRRLMLPAKNNLASDVSGLAYSTVESPDRPGVAVVAWEAGAVSTSADDALSGKPGPSPVAMTEASEWLAQHLASGPQEAKAMKDRAKADGISPRTLDRAKGRLKVASTLEPVGADGKRAWVWRITQGGKDAK